MLYNYLVPLIIPYGLFYLVGICLIILILKRHLDNEKVDEDEKKYDFNKKLKFLIYFFLVLFTSMFVGLYNTPYINLTPLPSLLEVLLISTIIGSISFALIVLVINFSIKKFDVLKKPYFKTKFSCLALIIFICFSIFTYQPYNITQNSNYYISSNAIVSQDFTEVAYGISSNINLSVSYLVVTNLTTKIPSFYNLLFQSLMGFYNDSIIIYEAGSEGLNSFNLLTGKVNPYSNYPVFYINSNSKFKIATVQPPDFNTTGNATLFLGDYLEPLNHTYELISLSNFTTRVGGVQLDISPDLSKVVLINRDYFYFYTINGLNSTFLKSLEVPLFQYSDYFNFVPWSDPSVLYFSDSNSSLTELYSFNFTSLNFQEVANVNRFISIAAVNEKLSLFVTTGPVEIYSYKNSQAYLEQTTEYGRCVWDNNINRSILSDANKIIISNFDAKTNQIHQDQILYVAPSTDEINILLSIYNINLGITSYFVLTIMFYYYRERKYLLVNN